MAKNQRSYAPGFEQQIVELYDAGGTSYLQLECEYGISRSALSNWVEQFSPIKVLEKEAVTLKEYEVFQREVQRLKIEDEILKKRPPYSQKNNSRSYDFYLKASKPLHSVPALQCLEIP